MASKLRIKSCAGFFLGGWGLVMFRTKRFLALFILPLNRNGKIVKNSKKGVFSGYFCLEATFTTSVPPVTQADVRKRRLRLDIVKSTVVDILHPNVLKELLTFIFTKSQNTGRFQRLGKKQALCQYLKRESGVT